MKYKSEKSKMIQSAEYNSDLNSNTIAYGAKPLPVNYRKNNVTSSKRLVRGTSTIRYKTVQLEKPKTKYDTKQKPGENKCYAISWTVNCGHKNNFRPIQNSFTQ